MNYYDELGILPSAGAEDIRKAHRMLSKVLHPDLQNNSEMQAMAKIQMSRINAIVDTLLDPQRRLQYDQSLRAQPPRETFRRPLVGRRPAAPLALPGVSALSLLGTLAVAVLLALGTIWLLGGVLHFETTAERSRLSPQPEVSPRTAIPIVTDTVRRSAAEVHRVSARVAQSDATVGGGDTTVIAAPSEAPSEIPAPRPEPTPPQPLISPVAVPDPAPPAPAAPNEEPTLAGLWIYAPSLNKPALRSVRVYEPEYIQLRIDVENKTLRGEYAARYLVSDRPISSEVAFVFEGKHDDVSFPWNASDGTRGTVDLKMLGARLMEVKWRVDVFGARIGLGAGTAVLARQLKP